MTETPNTRDGSHDFDFFVGKWKGHNHRLRERLVGSTEWEEFEGLSEVRNILGGTANFDEVVFECETGRIYGTTLRLYDQKSHEWSIFWAATGSGSLDIPMIGSFDEKTALANFMPTKPIRVSMFTAASFGRRSLPILFNRNKPSPPMVAKRGKPTGLRNSLASSPEFCRRGGSQILPHDRINLCPSMYSKSETTCSSRICESISLITLKPTSSPPSKP